MSLPYLTIFSLVITLTSKFNHFVFVLKWTNCRFVTIIKAVYKMSYSHLSGYMQGHMDEQTTENISFPAPNEGGGIEIMEVYDELLLTLFRSVELHSFYHANYHYVRLCMCDPVYRSIARYNSSFPMLQSIYAIKKVSTDSDQPIYIFIKRHISK